MILRMCRWILIFTCILPALGQAVISAQVTKLEVTPERNRIDATFTNTGERSITAFALRAFATRSGVVEECGARGQDMIDGSDPMPGTHLLMHVARHWVMPGENGKLDLYPGRNCAGLPLGEVKVEVVGILFDDGTGEGSSALLDMSLRIRKLKAAERMKWLSAFSALRQASDLSSESLKLYQAIVQANYTSDLDPGQASQEAEAKVVRTELQSIALAIHEWAQQARRPANLEQGQMMSWRLTDLEQRTVRLVKGAGSF